LTPVLQATTRHWRAFLRIASNLRNHLAGDPVPISSKALQCLLPL